MDYELQPHQERVLRKLRDKDSILLYHGLGSGKTLSSIAASEGDTSNVVVPASLRENYKKELSKFKADPSTRNVVSYEYATRHGLPKAHTLIVDEAHRLGTSSSGRTQSLYEEAPKHERRILLTGTPIRNYPHELAPIIKILNPEAKIPLVPQEFQKRFIEERVVHNKGWNRVKEFFGLIEPGVEYTIKNEDKLKKAVEGRVDYHAPESDRFPSVTSRVVPVEMDPDQAKYYKVVTDAANPILAEKIKAGMPPSKKELNQMNAFMTAARMVSNTTKPYGGSGTSNKIKQLVTDFEELNKKNPAHKGVIYSNYLEGGLNEISSELEKKKIPHYVFSGQLNDKERKALVNDFNEGKVKALLISSAGTEGLDLKGGRSVQILEPHWNNARLNQAIGRVVRLGSHEHLPEDQRNVQVMHYHSTLPQTYLQKKLDKPPNKSADQYLTQLSATKDELNNKFLDVLKKSS